MKDCYERHGEHAKMKINVSWFKITSIFRWKSTKREVNLYKWVKKANGCCGFIKWDHWNV
jgi:hypothetical protein